MYYFDYKKYIFKNYVENILDYLLPSFLTTQTYYILDNYHYVFKVVTYTNKLKIYESISYHKEYALQPCLYYGYEKIFIGKSPYNIMTSYSGEFGEQYDGNTILIKVKNNYIYIGSCIFEFTSLSPIKKYVSPVANNCVPYPYAIDENDNYYLMNEKVIISNIPSEYLNDPYNYYYNIFLITTDMGCVPPKEPKIKHFNNIDQWFIGDNLYTLHYVPFPSENYDRLDFGEGMKFKYVDGTTKMITKSDYIELHKQFGEFIECKPLIVKVRHEH